MTLLIDIDPYAPHDEDCDFWHGGACRCKPEAREALERDHCHECDYVNVPHFGRCGCLGRCICEREEGCPCLGRLAPALCSFCPPRRGVALPARAFLWAAVVESGGRREFRWYCPDCREAARAWTAA